MDTRLGSICGILFGILVLAAFVVTVNFPADAAAAASTLAGYSSLRTAFLAGDIFLGLAAVFAIPYFVELRNAYADKPASVVVAQGAIGFGAAVIFGFLVLIVGVGLYGFHTIKGRPFPRWLGYVGIVAAILFGIGALPVSGAYVGLIGGVILLLVWIFATSALLWRASGRMAPG